MKILKMGVRNAAYQQFEALSRNREKRTQRRLFFLEGVHLIEQAVLNGWAFEAVGVQDGVRLSGWAEEMIEKAQPDALYRIAPELMRELSDRTEPCELIALVHMKEDGLARFRQRGVPLFVLFDRPQGPGNLGTVIRSADAFDADGLIVTGHSADEYDPLCIRASVGAVFALPVARMESVERVLEWVSTLPMRPLIIGTSAKGDSLIDRVDLTGPTLLLIGNETFGLSKAWKEACDVLARIPIGGAASSLNAGCAASICLYEVSRQRGR